MDNSVTGLPSSRLYSTVFQRVLQATARPIVLDKPRYRVTPYATATVIW